MSTRPHRATASIRLLVTLVTLFGVMSWFALSASAAPGTSGPVGGGTFQTIDAKLCHDLDTNDDLNLSNDELAKAGGNDAYRDQVGSFCMSLPSLTVSGIFLTICHATGSTTHPYEVITIAKPAVISGHLGMEHQGGEDIIPDFSFNGQSYEGQGDQSTLANNCIPVTSTVTATATETETATATATVTVTPTATTVPGQPTDVPGKPTNVPAQPKPTKEAAGVSTLPSTGSGGSSSGGGQAAILLTAATAVILAGAGAVVSNRPKERQR